jgi:HD superfamily phosphohydrolase YqeK
MAERAVGGLPAWARVRATREAHVGRVVALLEQWADRMQLPDAQRARWLRAAWLHDALKDAPANWLRQLAPDAWNADSLRHGPAAAAMAARDGERDPGVLDAVRYHSVGCAGWDDVGRMLSHADFLEPGRSGDPAWRSRLAEAVPGDPSGVLRAVAAARIGMTVGAGQPLLPETVAFWNRLARGA